ncbi:hypothetical protein PF005_g16632 [Phytophthora fragariae]|uniref:Uncharacterized protein n=1 Tax=Phytophthora fragariae TaxID=53985 RepID=A0A6A3RMF8_9STRA|nr:hypothetical protein PF003_g37417 [Phytophthora fragariae]KAE8936163.1 hypothetical protein PF009_g13903 [Phytophthora fragariae]KAE9096717.1 hypothetical protein PF007_g16892 [Phytophthora fragariae]KAE9096795.1 hypothetical protein PF010_g16204 [Phytophthora fragariae]KAE9130337.1 hypothetical protein PF006_g15796 [Phytophthora fragariae]
MVVLRFSASKVALVTGLHDFGDAAEELLECVYQDREELLARDAARLRLRVVSKDEELETLVRKSGAAAAPQLRAALRWAKDRAAPAHVEAQKSRKLEEKEAQAARKLLAEKIHTSVGTRNEALALEAYERQTGSKVRLTNEQFYFLTFPPPPVKGTEEVVVDYSELAEQSQRTMILKRKTTRATATVDVTAEDSEGESVEDRDSYFSICGMVDGVADALTISADDEWGLTPVVVEVKNRVRGFRTPPPLYDHIQLAVYMKMLGVEHGDLVQCIYGADSRLNIQVSRVSLGVAPLCLPGSSTEQRQRDIWTEVIVPRLYAFTATVQKLRNEELLRLALLNGTEEERLAILRAECDFL